METNACKVSIIMPVYNKEKYVGRAIESVLKQTFSDWELIIIDDGSNDHSLDICRQYKDNRIKVFHTANHGVSHARNIGLENATGEYVSFLDADDWIEKDYLKNLYCPDKEMIIGGLNKVNSDGSIVDSIVPIYHGAITINEFAKKFYWIQKETGLYGFVSSKFINREIIVKNHLIFDENIHLAEDLNIFLDIYSYLHEIYFIQKSEYCYLQEVDGSLTKKRIDYFEQIKILDHLKQFCQKYDQFNNDQENDYENRISAYIYTIMIESSELSYQQFCRLLYRLRSTASRYTLPDKGIQKLIMLMYSVHADKRLYLLLEIKALFDKMMGKKLL